MNATQQKAVVFFNTPPSQSLVQAVGSGEEGGNANGEEGANEGSGEEGSDGRNNWLAPTILQMSHDCRPTTFLARAGPGPRSPLGGRSPL